MYENTTFPTPIYESDTGCRVYRTRDQFVVHNSVDDPDGVAFFECGNSLRHAIAYADNCEELSREALAVLATYPA